MSGSDPEEAMRDVVREVLRELNPGMLGAVPEPPRGNSHANESRNAEPPVGHDRRFNGHAVDPANGDAPDHPTAPEDAVIVAEVPAPPVAAVLRPSTWKGPVAPGEVIGDRPPARASEPRPQPRGSASPAASRSAATFSSPSTGLAPSAGAASAARVQAVTIDTDDDLERFVRELATRMENPRERRAIRAGRLRFALRRWVATPEAAPSAPPDAELAPARVVKGAVTERAVRTAAAEGARLVLGRGAVLTPLARDCARALGVEIERTRRC